MTQYVGKKVINVSIPVYVIFSVFQQRQEGDDNVHAVRGDDKCHGKGYTVVQIAMICR